MKKNIFTTSIYRSKNYNPSYNEIVLNELDQLKKINKGSCRSNRGGFQSYEIENIKILEETYSMVITHLENYLSCFEEVENKIKVKLINCWINENYKHSYNIPHVHPDCTFSGVFYLKTNLNCGKIEFHNGNSIIDFNTKYVELFPNSSDFHSIYSLLPTNNDLILFPSYLKHGVLENLSDEPRVSISFNLNVNKHG
tara:strand:- start:39 stop:629 length:591 start_codon:yes stop_codon:yes gene_type:complete